MTISKNFKVFNDSCPIMPEVVAMIVVEQAERLFRKYVHSRVFSDSNSMILMLVNRAEETCKANQAFKKSIIGAKGDKGRDRLYSFMRHWLAAYLVSVDANVKKDELVFNQFANGLSI